jgi:tetratricopeptide (TPR) repeat protein
VEKNKGLWILGIYFFLSVYLLPMFPHGGSANELTRWATAASLVEKSSFEISWTANLIGANVDATRIDERIYPVQPPGGAVLAAPIYALSRVIIGAPDASNIRISWFAMRFFISTLPLLLLGLWLYNRDSDELSLAALFFATPLFVDSLLLSASALVAVSLYFAFRLLYDTERIFLRNCILAGFICGFALTCEYAAIAPVLVFAVGLFFADKRNESRWQNVFFFALGAAPFVALLLIYNYAVFGSFFAFFQTYVTPDGATPSGFGFPTFSNAYSLLISPARGLFFFAPLLFLPVAAFFTSRERKSWRHRVKVAAIAVSIIAMCGHAPAGSAFGAQHLALTLPLLLDSFFDGEIYEFSNVWQGALFTVSFLLCALPALAFPFAPLEFKYPHNNFWGKLLLDENWFAPNMANVFGLSSSVWTLLPVIIAFAAVLFILRRYARRPSRFGIGVLVGLLMFGVYLGLPNLDNSENEFRRAAVAERHYKPANRLEIYKDSTDPQMRARAVDLEWQIADARAFAPNDFPYLPTREPNLSPSMELTKAAELRKQGRTAEAEAVLQKGKEDFPFARCEMAVGLAEIFRATERKDLARQELESVQNLFGAGSRLDCLRGQFALGALYREAGETEKASRAFKDFLNNTNGADDPEINDLRRQISDYGTPSP